MISQISVDRARFVYKYFRYQNGLPEVYRTTCFAVANKIKYLIYTKASLSEFSQLKIECDKLGIRKMGSGAHEMCRLLNTIIKELG